MADTTFVSKQTVITASWAQEVNNFTYRNSFLPSTVLTPTEGLSLDAARFGVPYGGAVDGTTSLQTALNSGATEILLSGSVLISSYILVPAGVTLRGVSTSGKLIAKNAMPAYVPFGGSHQGQMVLLLGDGSCARSLTLNGGNFTSGGVAVASTLDNRVEDCHITNCGNSQGILFTGSLSPKCSNNFIQYAQHGIQLWQTTGGTIVGNTVRCVDGGGIWTADTADLQITGNSVSDCGDVGLDLEGGINNSITSNVASACNNGELTWFNNGTGSGRVPLNNTLSSNTLTRRTTYLAQVGGVETPTATNATNGAVMVFSVTVGQQGITFKDNTVYATGRTALFTNDLGTQFCGIQIEGNTFASDSLLHNVQRSYGIQVVGNTFRGLGATVAAAQNQFKNCSNGVWDNNIYDFDTAKNTLPALYYFTDAGMAGGVAPTISRNKFRNCGAFAFKHDPNVTGISATVMENEFSEVYLANGGVESTANGYPIYKNQVLYILINDSR